MHQRRKKLDEPNLYKLHRHYINLDCIQTVHNKEGSEFKKPLTFSGFIVEIEDLWFLITAGHIFNDISLSIEEHEKLGSKCEFTRWSISDSILGEKKEQPNILIPFSIDECYHYFSESDGYDYAAYPLNYLTCEALKRNGILPIRQEQWSPNSDEYELKYFFLLGTPSVFIKNENLKTQRSHVTVLLQLEDDKPEGFKNTHFPRRYAEVIFDSVDGADGVNFDISGMSGGPIFATDSTKNDYNYKLIGVQSSAVGKHIAFCEAFRFLDVLVENISSIKAGKSQN